MACHNLGQRGDHSRGEAGAGGGLLEGGQGALRWGTGRSAIAQAWADVGAGISAGDGGLGALCVVRGLLGLYQAHTRLPSQGAARGLFALARDHGGESLLGAGGE